MTYYRVTGDTESPLGPDRLTDEDGATVDLSGATVALHVWSATDGSTLISDDTSGNVSITDAANGEVEYEFQSGDLDTAGQYHYEWEVTFSDGGIETWPSRDGDYGVLVVRPEGA